MHACSTVRLFPCHCGIHDMTPEQVRGLYRLQDIICSLSRFDHLSKKQYELHDEAARLVQQMINTGPAVAQWKAHYAAGVEFQDKPEEIVDFLVAARASEKKPIELAVLKRQFGENVYKPIQRARHAAEAAEAPFTIVIRGGKVWTTTTSTYTMQMK